MDHQIVKNLFSDYIDGELSDEERALVHQHLEECDSCRIEFESFSKTINSLSGLHDLSLPSDFSKKVETTISRRSRGRFFGEGKFLHRFPFEWVSFVIILLLLALYIFVVDDNKNIKTGPQKSPKVTNSVEKASSDLETRGCP